jgi:hypothetical protein
MGNMFDRGDQQRMRCREPRIIQDIAPAHQGTEPHPRIGNLDLVEARQLAQVDQERGRRDAERQHRHERLPACDRLGVAVARGQESDRLGERRGTRIFERRQFHADVSIREGR